MKFLHAKKCEFLIPIIHSKKKNNNNNDKCLFSVAMTQSIIFVHHLNFVKSQEKQ